MSVIEAPLSKDKDGFIDHPRGLLKHTCPHKPWEGDSFYSLNLSISTDIFPSIYYWDR